MKKLRLALMAGIPILGTYSQKDKKQIRIKKNMYITLLIVAFQLLLMRTLFCQGYYKDIFVDGSVGLSYFEIPAFDSLQLEWEFINTEDPTLQSAILISNQFDENGDLLYPDGQPRFRLIFTHGGYSFTHGNSIGEEGRERIRQFYYQGGSYMGACGGCALFSSGRDQQPMDMYYGIWPGWIDRIPVGPLDADQSVPENSPLLQYRDFGGDYEIEDLYFYCSNFADQNELFPPETEALLYYNTPGYEMHDQISCWAYKESENTGRGVVIGSHPENTESGDKLELTEAMTLYALDGLSDNFQLKSELSNGVVRYMNKNTNDNDPDFTKIGDCQYHHFLVTIPEGGNDLFVEINGQNGYDFNLYLNFENFAFKDQFVYADTSEGSEKAIHIEQPMAGKWYIGVECASKVGSVKGDWCYNYVNNLEVLNGLEYSIMADWSPLLLNETLSFSQNDNILYQNTPNPFNSTTIINFHLKKDAIVSLTVNDIFGNMIATLINDKQYDSGDQLIQFNKTNYNITNGIYFYSLIIDNQKLTHKMIILN